MQNITKTFKFNVRELNLNPADVHRVLGGADAEWELTRVLLMELLSEIDSAGGMQGGYVRFDSAQILDDFYLNIGSQNFNVGKRIGSQLGDIEQAAVFVATAGPQITDWAQAWLQSDPLKGMIADTIASLVPEAIMIKIHQTLDDEMQAKGDRLTNAYNPGYCDWPMADQPKLFALLPDSFCGITLNEHALMLPLKSVSGIIGIGKNVRFLKSTCALCDRVDCAYRKTIQGINHSI